MAKQLRQLVFELRAQNPGNVAIDFRHFGVVGSGDMEVMVEPADCGGAVRVKVLTPVAGYDEVWRRVLQRFVDETGIADASMEINDNNATPVVVSMRLRQALAEVS